MFSAMVAALFDLRYHCRVCGFLLLLAVGLIVPVAHAQSVSFSGEVAEIMDPSGALQEAIPQQAGVEGGFTLHEPASRLLSGGTGIASREYADSSYFNLRIGNLRLQSHASESKTRFEFAEKSRDSKRHASSRHQMLLFATGFEWITRRPGNVQIDSVELQLENDAPLAEVSKASAADTPTRLSDLASRSLSNWQTPYGLILRGSVAGAEGSDFIIRVQLSNVELTTTTPARQ